MRITILLLAVLAATAPARAQTADTLDVVHVPVDVSVWRGASIGAAIAGPDSLRVVHNNFLLALPYGEAYRLDGIALGIAGTAYHDYVRGIQLGGLGNVAGTRLAGIQLAGLGNVAGGDALGLQAAGLANIAGGRLTGIQLAGLANIAGEGGGGMQASGLAGIAGAGFIGFQGAGLVAISGGRFGGFQAGGLMAVAGEGAHGVQMAGLLGIVGEGGAGIQIAGLGSVAGDRFTGAQLAGLGNIAGEVMGLQIAGLANIAGEAWAVQIAPINIAGTASGAQIGLVNIAGDQRGVPIGLFSPAGGVPIHLDVWVDETAALLVSVRSGSERIKNYGGIGARPFASGVYRWDVHAGLGYAAPAGGPWSWAVEGFAHALWAENFRGGPSGLFRLRVPVEYALGPGVAAFAGPSFSLHLASREEREEVFPSLLFGDEDSRMRGWIGGFAGVRIQISEGGTRLRPQ